jgi:hypothetical protein
MLSDAPGASWGADEWYPDAWCLAMQYRVRPLPSPGPLAFTCTWPARGIPASRVEVDGAAIRRAADVAVTLWPDDPYCSPRLTPSTRREWPDDRSRKGQ